MLFWTLAMHLSCSMLIYSWPLMYSWLRKQLLVPHKGWVRIDSVCQSESERQGACFSSTVFVRSLRVHLYGVGTYSLSLSQPLTTAICNAVMWSTVSLCPLHTRTQKRAHTHARIFIHTRGVTFHTTTNEPAQTHIIIMLDFNCETMCF